MVELVRDSVITITILFIQFSDKIEIDRLSLSDERLINDLPFFNWSQAHTPSSNDAIIVC